MCSVKGLIVVPHRLGQSLPPSVKTTGATLQFLKMTDDLSGLYQCETANPYGRNQARLYVSITSGEICCNRIYPSTVDHDVFGGSIHSYPGLCRLASFRSSPCEGLCPVVPGGVDRITARVAISADH